MVKTLLWLLGSLLYFGLTLDSFVNFVKSFSYETPYIEENVIELTRIPAFTGVMTLIFLCGALFCFSKTLKSYREI